MTVQVGAVHNGGETLGRTKKTEPSDTFIPCVFTHGENSAHVKRKVGDLPAIISGHSNAAQY